MRHSSAKHPLCGIAERDLMAISCDISGRMKCGLNGTKRNAEPSFFFVGRMNISKNYGGGGRNYLKKGKEDK
jgi:hypothetical protein